jgi:hypothetical protein
MRYKVTITELGTEGATMQYLANGDELAAHLAVGSILAMNRETQPAELALEIDATAYKIEIEVIR